MNTNDVKKDVRQCEKCGKFNDFTKFPECPFCESDNENTKETTYETKSESSITKKSIRRFFGKKENTAEEEIVSDTFSAYSTGSFNYKNAYEKNEESYNSTNDFVEDSDTITNVLQGNKKQNETEKDADFESPLEVSLKDEINNITKNNDGRTLGYFNLGDIAQSESISQTEKTAQSNPSRVVQSTPVVGWLVCVKGCHLGESFQLYDGNNSVGRGDANDVILYKEKSVSSNKHATITYEPRKRVFYVISGDSHGLTYLNEEMVTGSQKIKIYDLIEFGESAFVFIPLCGESFSWEEYVGRK